MEFRVILTNSQIQWNLSKLSHNPNVTSDFIIEHIDYSWSWYGLSFNEKRKTKKVKCWRIIMMLEIS